MKNNRLIGFLTIAFTICASFATAKDMIFDLGGVLVDTNKLRSFQCMGIGNTLQYCFYTKTSPLKVSNKIKTSFFTTLQRTAHLYDFDINDNLHCAYDEHGNILPYFMRAWLQGTMTCDTIRTMLIESVNLHPEWFAHKAEQKIIINLITMIFTPEKFIATRKIYPAGIAFIKKCKEQGHTIYALSNWDCESFELLKQKYPELFSLFDGIIISGEIHALKPHATIYQTLITHYKLNPEDCWFIDDQPENIKAAQEIGINGVVHPADFSKLTQNIKTAYSKSVMRRENLKNIGINVNNAKNISNMIIDGENISPTDSTSDNCRPANA